MTGDTDVGGISKVCPNVELIKCGLLKAMVLPVFNNLTISQETQVLLSYREVIS